jgi:hypothetical protein
VPESSPSEAPPTLRSKIVTSLPVVMTVVATVLAGLSSSEMTSAQYQLSLAAQLQSKAGDQWNFYQGKKLRSALQRNALSVLTSTAAVQPLDAAALQRSLPDGPASQALIDLAAGQLPPISPGAPIDSRLQAALAALDASRPDAELATLLAPVPDAVLEGALRAGQVQASAFDAALKDAARAQENAERQLRGSAAAVAPRRDLAAAHLSYDALRYDSEAQLNQLVANLYELQIRRSNLAAERHRHRSQLFFFGMLAAQMGVVIGTLALSAKQRNVLLTIAAGAGAAAISFAAYVYLCV